MSLSARSRLALLLAAAAPVPALRAQAGSATFAVAAALVRTEPAGGGTAASISRDHGRTFVRLPASDDRLHLRCGTFDPRRAAPQFAGPLAAAAGGRLFAVQLRTALVPEYRRALQAAGVQVLAYWPDNAYVVRG